MKYCKKCGMLLEDAVETCIRCGADVTVAENISYFPPEVQSSMDEQKEQSKSNMKTVIMIIAIIVILIGIAIGVLVISSSGGLGVDAADIIGSVEASSELDEATVESVEEVEEANVVEEEEELTTDEETSETDDSEAVDEVRVVKDSKGRYLRFVEETDDVGNKVLNVLYPEDFDTVDFGVEYDRYGNKFPISMTFSASGEDGGIHFLYMSPQQFWHKASETGQSYDNNRSAESYMTYYKYSGAAGYIEAMLKESYPNSKVELLSEEEYSTEVTKQIMELAEKKKSDLNTKTKRSDYAHIGEDTVYMVDQDAEYSANVYEYKITTSNKEEIFDKFFVPVIANKLSYANGTTNDIGTITEWYLLAFIAMEAGNEDYYEDYEEDFNLFIENCIPTDTFMKINQQFGAEIDEYVEANRTVMPITKNLLTDFGRNEECEMYEFYASVQNTLKSLSGGYVEGDGIGFYVPKDVKVGFISKDLGKVFISPAEDEYPGEDYEDMLLDKITFSVGVPEEDEIVLNTNRSNKL